MLLSKFFSTPSFSPTRLLIAVSLTTASIAGAASPAAAATCQADNGSCVLPIGVPPPPVADVPPAVIDEDGGGIGLLPFLIGLAALAALLWLLLDDDDEEEVPSP